MNPSLLTDNLPFIAVVIGALLLAWSQRSKFLSWIAKLKPKSKLAVNMSPAKRFDTFYALRCWCEGENHIGAVKVLDEVVLPAIVCSDRDYE